jgi:hypothetical protein
MMAHIWYGNRRLLLPGALLNISAMISKFFSAGIFYLSGKLTCRTVNGFNHGFLLPLNHAIRLKSREYDENQIRHPFGPWLFPVYERNSPEQQSGYHI